MRMEQAVRGDWLYEQRGTWQCLPDWCNAYIAFGQCVGQGNTCQGKRLIIGVAAPTRAYAAVFISLGVMLSRAPLPIDKPEADDHFLKLCDLPSGTAVTYQDSSTVKNGIFECYTEERGQFYLVIRLNKNHERVKVPPQLASRVRVSGKEKIELPEHQKGRPLPDEIPLLRACLDRANVADYCLQSRLDCMLVGNKKALEKEIHLPLAISSSKNDLNQGTFQDVLRVRQLVGGGQGYRSSIRSEREPKLIPDGSNMPFVTIFDGAAGFLKWRDKWRNSHWIVMLDETETQFEDAVNAFNHEYLDSHADTTPSLPDLLSPVSVMAYEEVTAWT